MSERFERLGFEKWRPQPAFDHDTKQRVLLPQLPWAFLGVAAMRTMIEHVREIDDPRCAEIVCTDPFAVVAPPEKKPVAKMDEWAHAAVDLVDLVVMLRREGIVVSPVSDWAWAERREGKLIPVVIALARASSFSGRRSAIPYSWISEIQSWLQEHRPTRPFDLADRKLTKALEVSHESHERAVDALFAALQPHLGGMDTTASAEAARRCVTVPPRVDFDLAIEMGEAAHAKMVREGREQWDSSMVCWPLAGAYHHRGCVSWEAGDRDAAIRDLDRALELDPHPRYLTTRALFAEALEDSKASSFHDGAMLSFLAPEPEPQWGVPPEAQQADECRSALARAAFRHRRGDKAGAIEDLRFVKSRWASFDGELGAQVEAFLARLT